MQTPPRSSLLRFPDAPAVVAGAVDCLWLTADGEMLRLRHADAALRARATPPILCHAPATARRLGTDRFPAYDVLELFAFVRPARFCLPTARGIADALALGSARTPASEVSSLPRAAEHLLRELADADIDNDAIGIARIMTRGGWPWGRFVLAALGDDPHAYKTDLSTAALGVWRRLGEWSDFAPDPPAGDIPIEPAEARERLRQMLGADAEDRPQQADYASAVSLAFRPRDSRDHPRLVLAEAGTGIGKTLGYLAAATLWAEKNHAPVWISTYTRNLQHQIDREIDRLVPDPVEKARRVVIRKGRENYLCLLNLEEAAAGLTTRPQDATVLGLMARWAARSRDGDMTGGDYPAWLADILGRGRTLGLADRRGECIYSACFHFHKCFIERSVRRARRADIVVANHALVMVQAALGGVDDTRLPSRYIFDEGHHVFDAADAAFAGLLSGQEAADLRRWVLGAEGRSRSRTRGLKLRVGDLVVGNEPAEAALEAALIAARGLPGDSWGARLSANNPIGPAETFLALVRHQVLARTNAGDEGYGLEAGTMPTIPGVEAAAANLEKALAGLAEPLRRLAECLATKLDAESATLDSATRQRIEAIGRGLLRRADATIEGWRAMLKTVGQPAPPEFVDWFAIDRIDGREVDVGMHRHWLDPTAPFAAGVARPAQGLLVTSATLTDGTGDIEADWKAAEIRTGARHLPDAIRASHASPFDYAALTRVIVVNDLRRDDIDQTAAAYREFLLAAGGGGLGLFTAISRLRAVHERIARPLEAAGLKLFAQHVDAMNTATLIDIFRAEEDSCLLGTDAVRDGVDVPGRSLRLIVFDRVPWPRPDILHRARKGAFGGGAYDDMIARLRLKQAFGRLVRRADDVGVFVLLDSRLPSRLAKAFPAGVEIQRVGLAQALKIARDFLNPGGPGVGLEAARP